MNAVLKPKPHPDLSHFSSEPLREVRSVKQPAEESGWMYPYKPSGLWVSVDGEHDWPAWCAGEDFGIASDRYRVVLSDPDSLLWITTAQGLLDFTDEYGLRVEHRTGHYMDWRRVAAEYPGIIIAPYQWSCRLGQRTHWYYGWDCASGCIWDGSAVAEVRLTS